MKYTVKQLAELAGVSPRTLRYYHSIGLLEPDGYSDGGYRLYGERALRRLQQILFFKELDFQLSDIARILDDAAFDVARALREHRKLLVERAERTQQLIRTVDKTLLSLEGGISMADRDYFKGFQPEDYRQEAVRRYGEKAVEESEQRLGRLSKEQQQALFAEFEEIVRAMMAKMDGDPAAPEVQKLVARLHRWLNNYYDCDLERLLGVIRTYGEDPDFRAMFAKQYHPDVPDFMLRAAEIYRQNQS
ncbi:MAG: MerR family transcriptional regulator [Limnochordia bacterium]|jgi:DNA-binding transcriptional MerR regulator